MSIIRGDLSSYAQERRIDDGFNFILSWDKKKYSENFYDLKDLAIFFRIKNIFDFASKFDREYSIYRNEKNKIKKWNLTFQGLNQNNKNNFEIIPGNLAINYLYAKNELFYTWINSIKDLQPYKKFLSYYDRNKESFFLLRDMQYEIYTSEGFQKVNLEFSENFRFKSKHGYYNLFNMPTHSRDEICARDKSFIYMIDFRQFEFRTFLNITGADVDFEDLDLYNHIGERLGLENPKIELISYLYSSRNDENLEKIIKKNDLIENIKDELYEWNGYPVFINEDFEQNKKVHSIIQSISYLIYLQKFAKIIELLKGYDSKLIYPLHDAMIFNILDSEVELIDKISEILSDNIYKTKEYFGKDLLNVKEIE